MKNAVSLDVATKTVFFAQFPVRHPIVIRTPAALKTPDFIGFYADFDGFGARAARFVPPPRIESRRETRARRATLGRMVLNVSLGFICAVLVCIAGRIGTLIDEVRGLRESLRRFALIKSRSNSRAEL